MLGGVEPAVVVAHAPVPTPVVDPPPLTEADERRPDRVRGHVGRLDNLAAGERDIGVARWNRRISCAFVLGDGSSPSIASKRSR